MVTAQSEGAKFRLIGVRDSGAVVLNRESGALTFYSPDGDRRWTDESSHFDGRTIEFLSSGNLGVSPDFQSSLESPESTEPPFVRNSQGGVVTLEAKGSSSVRVLAEQPDGTLVALAASAGGAEAKVLGLPMDSDQPVLDGEADSLDWLSSPSATAGFIYTYSPSRRASIWVLKQDERSRVWTYERRISAERGMSFGCISDDGSLLVHQVDGRATVERVVTGETLQAPTDIGHVSECHAATSSFVLVERRMSAGKVRTQYEWIDAASGDVRKRDSLPAEAMISLSPEGDTLIVSYAGSVITSSKSGETQEYPRIDGRITHPGSLHILNKSGSISVIETKG